MAREIWHIMKMYDLDIVSDVSPDLLCTICSKLLINASNAPCGCKFCTECIKLHLGNDNKHCPGKKDDCEEDIINFDECIQIDRAVNKKISKIIVKCPNKSCKLEIEIRNIENHLNQCQRKLVCPFSSIGCNQPDNVQTDIKQHLISEMLSHSRLLLENLAYLLNQVEHLKNELLTVNSTETKIQSTLSKLTDNSEIKILNQEISSLKNEIETMKNNQNAAINLINQQSRYKSDEEIKSIDGKNKINNRSNEFPIQVNSFENEIKKIKYKLNKSNQFVWIIDQFSNKLNQAKVGNKLCCYSEAFFSHKNGYKMKLILYPNGDGYSKGKYLSIFYCLCRGPFDNILKWPFTHDVKFEIADQRTGKVHVSVMVTYINNRDAKGLLKPTDIKNEIAIGDDLIDLAELLNSKTILIDDKLFIKCTCIIF